MDYKTLFIELIVLGLLGVIYYFWQKRRILNFENNKAVAVAAPLLQACLIEQDQGSFELLNHFIIALDDFIHGKSSYFPTSLAEQLIQEQQCPADLADIIKESLREIGHDKKD